jgi:hypothetical protein
MEAGAVKEIVTGACLLAVSALMGALLFGHVHNYEAEEKKAAAVILFVILFVSTIAFGFSGCGIFLRAVFR